MLLFALSVPAASNDAPEYAITGYPMASVPRSRYWLYGSVALGTLLLDLISKAWIFGVLGMPGEKPSIWFVPQVFGLTTSLNEGALFGMGQGMGAVFVVCSFLALGGILYWLFLLGAAHDRLLTFALACVTGGTIGNLYDRLGLPGLIWNYSNALHRVGEPVYAVRDWLDFRLIEWPIFNLADSFLVCGAALLLFHACFLEAHAPQPAGSNPPSEA